MRHWTETVEIIEGRCSGKMTFKGSRLSVYLLFDHLAIGGSIPEFIAEYSLSDEEAELVWAFIENLGDAITGGEHHMKPDGAYEEAQNQRERRTTR